MYVKNRGTGLMLLGISTKNNDDVAIGTLWFVFFFLPIFPIGGRQVKFTPSVHAGFSYEVISKQPLQFSQVIKTYFNGWFASPILLFAPMILAIMEIWLALGLPESWHLPYALFAIAWFIIGFWLMLDRYEAKGMVDLGEGDVLAQKAVRLYQKGRYTDAIALFDNAQQAPLKIHNRSNLLTLMGLSHANLGQFEQALNNHREAIKVDPQNHQAWVNQGVAHRALHQYQEAEQAYQQALQVNPKYAEAHSSLGVLYMLQGQHQKSLEHLQHAVTLDGSVASIHANLAIVYAASGDFVNAENFYSQATKLGYPQPEIIRNKIDRYQVKQ